MTKKEIETRIRQEQNRVTRLKGKIADIQSDINATKTAIEFWKLELAKVEKGEK